MIYLKEVSFFTPIIKPDSPVLNLIEKYVWFSGSVSEVFVEYEEKWIGVEKKETDHWLKIAGKLITMILSAGLFPLIAFTVRLISRCASPRAYVLGSADANAEIIKVRQLCLKGEELSTKLNEEIIHFLCGQKVGVKIDPEPIFELVENVQEIEEATEEDRLPFDVTDDFKKREESRQMELGKTSPHFKETRRKFSQGVAARQYTQVLINLVQYIEQRMNPDMDASVRLEPLDTRLFMHYDQAMDHWDNLFAKQAEYEDLLAADLQAATDIIATIKAKGPEFFRILQEGKDALLAAKLS